MQNKEIAIRRGRLWRLGLGLVGVVLALSMTAATPKKADARPPELKVTGTQIIAGKNTPIHLRGVNVASMEWSSDGEGHVLTTIQTAIRDWHVNIVRVPLAQDRWFGKAPEQKDDGKAYRTLVKQIVTTCSDANVYVMLDLHWSDMGEWGKDIGQHFMPDENSIAFWKSCAAEYKNNPAVLFDLYNEPHDVSWDIWHDGGSVTERNRRAGTEKTYKAVGMQSLLDTVRSTGAKNVIVAGGLDWAYDFSGILADKALTDTKGNGIIYANHAYPFKGETVAKWITRMERATAKFPVIVSEFGSDPKGGAGLTGEQWVREVLEAIRAHDWNYTAWDLHPSAGPTLISGWDYKPTPHFGVWVQQSLLGTLPRYTPPVPGTSATTQPPASP